MGVRKSGRQPLWVQRLRSAQMLDTLMKYKNHPLIREKNVSVLRITGICKE